MNSDYILERITSIDSFSNRELALLCNFDRKKVWQFLTRLNKWQIVRPKTRKNSVVFWEILDLERFREELARFLG